MYISTHMSISQFESSKESWRESFCEEKGWITKPWGGLLAVTKLASRRVHGLQRRISS